MKNVWMLTICGEFDFYTTKKKAMAAMEVQMNGYRETEMIENKYYVSWKDKETGDEVSSIGQWAVN
jgi:hypothetical protein